MIIHQLDKDIIENFVEDSQSRKDELLPQLTINTMEDALVEFMIKLGEREEINN